MAPRLTLTPVQISTLRGARRTGLLLVGGRWRIKGARAAPSGQTIAALVAKGCLAIDEDVAELTDLGREVLAAAGSSG